MNMLHSHDILQVIGNTSLVQLCHVVPPDCGKVFVKLEWENPTGSMKDRAALAMISRAEADGRLEPGDTIVEFTGGSTGTSPAFSAGEPEGRAMEQRIGLSQLL